MPVSSKSTPGGDATGMTFPELVSDQKTFNNLIEEIRKKPSVAIDTEFHCEKRYWADLFLIQFAADGVGPVAVDPVAITDLTPLAELFADENVVKILHSARNDLSILFHDIDNFEAKNLFDTQVAAAFLGYGEQISLVNLVFEICGVKARKKYSMSDWSVRPLGEGQLEYALDDVRYLVEVYEALQKSLEKKGRVHWLNDESKALTNPNTYGVIREKLFAKARSSGKVKKSHFSLLWCLVNWREDLACSLNRPRYYIARDHLLCRLALLAPHKKETIHSLRGLPGGFVEKYGEDIIKIVEDCQANPPTDVPRLSLPRHDWGYKARKDILRIFLKMKAKELDISPSLLLPKDDFEIILCDPPTNHKKFMESANLPNWRKEALGAEMVDLLSGKLALKLKKGKSLRFVKV